MTTFRIIWPTFSPFLLLQFSIFFPPCTYNFAFWTCVFPVRMPFLYCCSIVLCFTANVTLLHQLNDEFDGVWISCGLRHRFRCGYDGFGFYDHSDIMTKMAWSQVVILSGVYCTEFVLFEVEDLFSDQANTTTIIVRVIGQPWQFFTSTSA